MVRISERFGRKNLTLLAAAGLLAVGGGVGAGAMYAARPVAVMGPVALVPIGSLARGAAGPLSGDTIASVRGQVAEVFGSRFTLRDASGTALVETGLRGGEALVSPGQTVTVQGRFGDSVLHAAFLVGADGRVTALEPRGPRHGGERHGRRGGPDGPGRGPGHGPGDDRGPDGPDGPGDGPGAPPPPPMTRPTAAPATGAPATTAPAAAAKAP